MELLIYNSHMYQAKRERLMVCFSKVSELPNDRRVDLIEVDFE